MDPQRSITPLESGKRDRSTTEAAQTLNARSLTIVRISSAATTLAGLVVLAGWTLRLDSLKALALGGNAIRVNAAIGLALIGASFWFFVGGPSSPWRSAIARSAAIAAALIGVASMVEYLFHCDLHIDELLFVDDQLVEGFFPGRPAPAVAVSFVLISIALLVMNSPRVAVRRLVQAFILAPLLVSILALLGFAYGVASPFRLTPYVAMAEPMAAVFIVLCVGLLHARRDFEIMAPIQSPNLGGVVARKLLPAILILPLLERLWLQGEYQGRYGREFGVALASVTAMALLLGFVWWSARSLNLVDMERLRAEDALRESERIYRAIGESIDYGVWLCDREGKTIYTSPSLLRLVGMTPEQSAEFGWSAALHPNDAERTIAAWKECVRVRGKWDVEHRFRGVDGGWHSVLARGVPVTDERGAIVGWAGINLDIRRLKEAEGKLLRAFDDLEARIQERTAELTTVNDMLRRSLEEKEVLLKEVHHRVKNNLQVVSSLLHLQSLHTRDEASVEMFHESQNRVRSMALVHERLYRSNDLAQVDFTDYIQGVANSLFQSYGVDSGRIGLKINVGDAPLSIDTAVPCGLVINEMVSNCLKHAFKGRDIGRIQIDLVAVTDADILLCVADDGVGLPPGIDPEVAESFGMQVIVALVDQLHGRLEVIRGDGTEFRVLFPSTIY